MKTEKVSVYQIVSGIDHELEIKVKCWIHPESKGQRGKYGVPLEPDIPAHIDDYEIQSVSFVDNDKEFSYDKFKQKYNVEIELDEEQLFEQCSEKAREDYIEKQLHGL